MPGVIVVENVDTPEALLAIDGALRTLKGYEWKAIGFDATTFVPMRRRRRWWIGKRRLLCPLCRRIHTSQACGAQQRKAGADEEVSPPALPPLE